MAFGGVGQGVQFIPFGVQLRFVPYITDRDRVRLQVSANVSTRDPSLGTNIGGSSPVLGDQVKLVLIGGFEVGPNALIRFYTLHVIGLPLVAAIFMAVHFWRIRRDGGMARPL